MEEKRAYYRLPVKIYGTLFKKGMEIPITIHNLSENGIGIRYQYRDCPDGFNVKRGDVFVLQFIDDNSIYNDIQTCKFKIIQVREHTTHGYIGAQLISDANDYAKYVSVKKISDIAVAVQFLPLASGYR